MDRNCADRELETTAVRLALAGDAEAMADLKGLHVTFWQVGK